MSNHSKHSKKFYCHTCNESGGDFQTDSFDVMRRHARKEHGREPYCNKDRKYGSEAAKTMYNYPELMLAA